MTFLIILIILVLAWPYIRRWLQPYLYRWMQRRTEDFIRSSMGMPPRDKGNSRRQSHTAGSRKTTGGSRRRGQRVKEEPVIPKEYAEDVEFTEVRSYSEEEKIGGESSIRYAHESQVSDAEIIEIKKER